MKRVMLAIMFIVAIPIGGLAQDNRPKDIVTDDYIVRFVSHKEPKSNSEKAFRTINPISRRKYIMSEIFSVNEDNETLSVSDAESKITWWKGSGKRIRDLGERYFAAYVSRGQILVQTRGSVEICFLPESVNNKTAEEHSFILQVKDENGYAQYLLKNTLSYKSVRVAYRGLDGKKYFVTLIG